MKVRQRQSPRAVVGLDVSLQGPGLCVASGSPRSRVDAALKVETTVIRAGETLRGPERLSVVSRGLFRWLSVRQSPRPGDVYAMEGYAYSAGHAHSMGEMGGCIRKTIWELGCNLVVIPPSTLKKFLTGKGIGDKNIVMKHVYKRWGFDIDDDNQCDAFGCALVALVSCIADEDMKQPERDVIAKCEFYAGRNQVWNREALAPPKKKKKRKALQ